MNIMLGATAQEALNSPAFDKMVNLVQNELYQQWKSTGVTSFKNRWAGEFDFFTDYKNFYGQNIEIIERILAGLIEVCIDQKISIPQTTAGMSGISMKVLKAAGLKSDYADLMLVSDVLQAFLKVRKSVSTYIQTPHSMPIEATRGSLESFWHNNKWTIILGLTVVAVAKTAARTAVSRVF